MERQLLLDFYAPVARTRATNGSNNLFVARRFKEFGPKLHPKICQSLDMSVGNARPKSLTATRASPDRRGLVVKLFRGSWAILAPLGPLAPASTLRRCCLRPALDEEWRSLCTGMRSRSLAQLLNYFTTSLAPFVPEFNLRLCFVPSPRPSPAHPACLQSWLCRGAETFQKVEFMPGDQ